MRFSLALRGGGVGVHFLIITVQFSTEMFELIGDDKKEMGGNQTQLPDPKHLRNGLSHC